MNTYMLVPVTKDSVALQTVLRSLTKMYCYEWSQYTGMDVDESGDVFAFDTRPSRASDHA